MWLCYYHDESLPRHQRGNQMGEQKWVRASLGTADQQIRIRDGDTGATIS